MPVVKFKRHSVGVCGALRGDVLVCMVGSVVKCNVAWSVARGRAGVYGGACSECDVAWSVARWRAGVYGGACSKCDVVWSVMFVALSLPSLVL